MLKFILVFLVLSMSIGVNLPDNMIARLGFQPDYLKVALAAWIITGLVVYRQLALIVLVVALCIGANLPVPLAEQFNINRDYMLAALVAIVILPWVVGERLGR